MRAAEGERLDRARHDFKWPPRPGTPLNVYLPDSEVQHDGATVLLTGDQLCISAPRTATAPPLGAVLKLLFPVSDFGWGYDGVLSSTRPTATRSEWLIRLTRGPVRVERRDTERVAQKRLATVVVDGRPVPCHILDRSAFGMRCIVGRGVRVLENQIVEVIIDEADGDVVRGARVVWSRIAARGVEFGLRHDGSTTGATA